MTIKEFNHKLHPLLPSSQMRRLYRLWAVLDLALEKLTPKERRELLEEFTAPPKKRKSK